jgi:two-component system alkaline phosphatase synthesis response regulator PhoP
MSKILIVDDSKFARAIIVNGLKKEGFETIEAENGQEAIDIAKIEKPNLVIMDVVMPVLNGIEATKILKNLEETKKIPILILTGQNTKEEILEGFNAGADEYLCKPFKFNELLSTIKTLLNLYR